MDEPSDTLLSLTLDKVQKKISQLEQKTAHVVNVSHQKMVDIPAQYSGGLTELEKKIQAMEQKFNYQWGRDFSRLERRLHLQMQELGQSVVDCLKQI